MQQTILQKLLCGLSSSSNNPPTSDCNCIHESCWWWVWQLSCSLMLFWCFFDAFCWSLQYKRITMTFCFLKLFAGISTDWPGWRQGRKTAHPPIENGPATIMKLKHDCYCWATKHLYHPARHALNMNGSFQRGPLEDSDCQKAARLICFVNPFENASMIPFFKYRVHQDFFLTEHDVKRICQPNLPVCWHDVLFLGYVWRVRCIFCLHRKIVSLSQTTIASFKTSNPIE